MNGDKPKLEIPVFDKEAVYDKEIKPLVGQIIAICEREGIPMLATFCYASRPPDFPEGGKFATSAVGRGGWAPQELHDAKAVIVNDDSEVIHPGVSLKIKEG